MIVRRLGRRADTNPCHENSYVPQQDLSGNQVNVVREIQLEFRWWDGRAKDKYSIWHREVFVVAIMLDIQVLFGKDYLMERGILTVNEPAMQRMTPELPLTPNLKITKKLKELRAEQERQQRIKKERAEAKRKSLERQQAQHTGPERQK